jgi:hypothetical protein
MTVTIEIIESISVSVSYPTFTLVDPTVLYNQQIVTAINQV